jgi:hypothetical protein
LGNGNGTFQAPQRYSAGGVRNLAVADFNGDGFPDIATPNVYTVTILLNAASWGGGH